MKLHYQFIPAALLTCGLTLSASAQSEATTKLDSVTVTDSKIPLGPEKTISFFVNVEIKNFQDESLGRITDLGVDLINGRIVEALVESDSSLNVDNKIVAVPPLALIPDAGSQVYRLDVSRDTFKRAAAIDFTNGEESGRSQRVAAAYRLFGQEPYFLEEGHTASQTDERPKVKLGYVQRASKLQDMPVGNYQGDQFGNVWSLIMDIPKGRIVSVIVLTPGNFLTKSIVPAMALSFNAKRDALLLDDTKLEYEGEPRYIYTAAAFGNAAYSEQESYKGPHTNVALEQGRSYRDIDQTLRIHREIRAANINSRQIEVGTLHDRVTLRGRAVSADDKRRIGEIAIAAASVALVDNQITVGLPAADVSPPVTSN